MVQADPTIRPAANAGIIPDRRFADRWGDYGFRALTSLGALALILILTLLVWKLVTGAWPTLHRFGFELLVQRDWSSGDQQFGALPFIYGTLVTSAIALVIAVPLSIFTAIYLTDLAPTWVRQPLVSVIEMLAAVPSVIWGLWGIFVLVPWLRVTLFPLLKAVFGHIPGVGILFSGPIFGLGYLSAGIIVAVMITPIVTAVSREILRSVPPLQREAAYALGGTRWEVTKIAVLSYAKRGLLGAAVLGLGRALGETMAVTMVIGNSPQISTSLFAPGYSLASVIANEFGEAGTDAMYTSALFELGLILLGITVIVNIIALVMVRAFTKQGSARSA
jgi:phosphate transport system permease protein